MSSRRATSGQSSSHAAVRPRSTASAPAGYFSAFTSPLSGGKTSGTRGLGEGRSARGFSGERGPSTSSSAYKRSPRPNFISRMWAKITRLIRDFVRYARQHPFKVVVPLVMALVGGGALAGLVKRMGGLQGMGLGGLANMGLDKWIGVGHGVRTGVEGYMGGWGGGGGARGMDMHGLEGQMEGLEGQVDGQGSGGFNGMNMMKGAVKIASAFL